MDLAQVLKDRFSVLLNFCDNIRIVNPLSKQVISIDNETKEITVQKGTCYHCINKSSVCHNCVSYRSYLYNDTFVKIERLEDNRPLRIISSPIKIRSKTYVVEILKEIDYNRAGVEDDELNESISSIMDELNMKVITDDLTGVYNRRFINERVTVDIFKQTKSEKSYIMAMGDIDFFKSINDKYGHLAGDLVLMEVAKIINEDVKEQSGWTGRYGGEEFLFVYYNKSLEEVKKHVELIRKKIEEKVFLYGDYEIKVTASFGIAEFTHKYDDAKKFVEEVDKQLYKAKDNGRNRIEY